jgi:hypothetical protein
MRLMSDQTLIEKIRNLPPEKVAEVEEFVDLLRTSNDRSLTSAASKLSEDAFARVWDNPEDAVYDRL